MNEQRSVEWLRGALAVAHECKEPMMTAHYSLLLSKAERLERAVDQQLTQLDRDYESIKNVKFGGIGGKIVSAYPMLRQKIKELSGEVVVEEEW
jgi:hypothetical protein